MATETREQQEEPQDVSETPAQTLTIGRRPAMASLAAAMVAAGSAPMPTARYLASYLSPAVRGWVSAFPSRLRNRSKYVPHTGARQRARMARKLANGSVSFPHREGRDA